MDEIRGRLAAVEKPTGKRGRPSGSAKPETILFALVARRWRAMGYSVRSVALALSPDPRLGRVRTDRPMTMARALEELDSKPVRDRAELEGRRLEQRVKDAERQLRKLERSEGISAQPVRDKAERERDARAQKRIAKLQDAHARCLARLSDRLSPDQSPTCLRAEADLLGAEAERLPDGSSGRRERLMLAYRARWLAAECDPKTPQRLRDAALRKFAGAAGFRVGPASDGPATRSSEVRVLNLSTLTSTERARLRLPLED